MREVWHAVMSYGMLSITVDKTWSDEPGYIMYYEGVSTQDNKHRILSAHSSDGRIWNKTNKDGPVLDIGTTCDNSDDDTDTWDCDGVGSPHILRIDDGSQRMYYVGQQQKNTAVGVTKVEYPSNGSKNKVPLSLRSKRKLPKG
mmetsp:Transcript_19001/g.21253  ORF Transcript_19001/g.21253 Transcript_19001/m.21253 type:complete len:143 (-) Transcript_19001:339-767(-)